MPRTFQEGRLRFTFPKNWVVFRPEESAYYKRRFQNFCGGCKETDFVGWDVESRTVWLLEVKDYTTVRRMKPANIYEEVAAKVRDTLAFLAGAAANANPDAAGTRSFALSCMPAQSFRVVLHLEQPMKPSKLFPPVKGVVDATQKLRGALRCVDAHARCVSLCAPSNLPWGASWSAG